jgi:hypothetical protein
MRLFFYIFYRIERSTLPHCIGALSALMDRCHQEWLAAYASENPS